VARTNPESLIQSAICEYLIAKGFFVTRINNIPAPIKNATGAWQLRKLPKYTAPGFPDILAIGKNKGALIEVKRLGGRLSPAQKECHERIRQAGGNVIVAHSIDDVIAAGL
jgi:hypothetical protein